VTARQIIEAEDPKDFLRRVSRQVTHRQGHRYVEIKDRRGNNIRYSEEFGDLRPVIGWLEYVDEQPNPVTGTALLKAAYDLAREKGHYDITIQPATRAGRWDLDRGDAAHLEQLVYNVERAPVTGASGVVRYVRLAEAEDPKNFLRNRGQMLLDQIKPQLLAAGWRRHKNGAYVKVKPMMRGKWQTGKRTFTIWRRGQNRPGSGLFVLTIVTQHNLFSPQAEAYELDSVESLLRHLDLFELL